MKNIKNWIDGDTFAVKIENYSEEYNGRYLIIIKRTLPLKIYCDKSYPYDPYVYAKITNSNRIPQNLDEINNLEFIKFFATYYDKDTINFINNGKDFDKLIPDEFNYLYTCIFNIDFYKKNKDIVNFIYLGNFDITLPKNELVSDRTSYMCATTKFSLVEDILKNYKLYNCKEGSIFQPEGREIFKENYFNFCKIQQEVEELMDEYRRSKEKE